MIYWDYNATAPIHPKVSENVKKALDHYPGNPSSVHQLGQKARAYIERVRRLVAGSLKCHASEVLFTGSASETNMIALRGYWLKMKTQKGQAGFTNKVLASRIEHPSVCANLDTLAEFEGIEIVEIPRQPNGQADLAQLEEILRNDRFFLISIQAASNETGILQNWKGIAELAKKYQTPFHSDMVQWIGRLPIDFEDAQPSSATFSFHKSGGIRASSIFYLNKETAWQPNLCGGGQEKKRWAGTENVLSVASIEAFFEELEKFVEDYQTRVRPIRDQFEKRLVQELPDTVIVGQDTERLPNTSFCIFPGMPSDLLLMSLDLKNICASAGSACSTGLSLPSSTLQKLGYSKEDSQSAIRFSLGASSSAEQVEPVIEAIAAAVHKHLKKERKTSESRTA